MTEETPSQRLDRLLKGEAQRKYFTPKDQQFDPDHQSRAKRAVQGIVEELKKALGDGRVEIHEVRVGDTSVTIDGKDLPASLEDLIGEMREVRKNAGHDPEESKILSMAIDLSPLHQIRDEKVRHHGEMVLRTHDAVVRELGSLDVEHALPQFVIALGSIVVKAGMSGAMIVAGQRGQGSIGPEDLQSAMVGAVGGVVLSALRYGQQHPDALTLADGVDDTQITSAVDHFLAGLAGEGHNPEEGEQ